MRRLIEDEGMRTRMGEAARRRAAEFGPDVVVPQFEEAYELALVARRQRVGRNAA